MLDIVDRSWRCVVIVVSSGSERTNAMVQVFIIVVLFVLALALLGVSVGGCEKAREMLNE